MFTEFIANVVTVVLGCVLNRSCTSLEEWSSWTSGSFSFLSTAGRYHFLLRATILSLGISSADSTCRVFHLFLQSLFGGQPYMFFDLGPVYFQSPEVRCPSRVTYHAIHEAEKTAAS